MPVAAGATMGRSGFAAVEITQRNSVPFIGAVPTGFGKGHAGRRAGRRVPDRRVEHLDASDGDTFGLALTGYVPGVPSPVATFMAKPNDTFNVVPVTTKCYVS